MKRSLDVLKFLKDNGANRTKSGIMVGLGENEDEVFQTLTDLRNSYVDVVTIGQYLQPQKSICKLILLLLQKLSKNMNYFQKI